LADKHAQEREDKDWQKKESHEVPSREACLVSIIALCEKLSRRVRGAYKVGLASKKSTETIQLSVEEIARELSSSNDWTSKQRRSSKFSRERRVVTSNGLLFASEFEGARRHPQSRAFPDRCVPVSIAFHCASFHFLRSSGIPTPANDISRIQRVVFLIKENHTFDNYFGIFPSADGVTTGITSNVTSIPLRPVSDSNPTGNLCNSWDCSVLAMNGGRGSLDADTQATEAIIRNDWAYARRFALADHYFTSVHGPSLPNYLYMVAAPSSGVIDNGTGQSGAACDGEQFGAVTVIDAQGHSSQQARYFDFPTLPGRLNEAGTRWRCSVIGGGAMNLLRHSEYWADDFAPNEQIITDAQTGNPPAMSWVFPDGADEHPPASIGRGENWTVQVLNAILQGPDWNSTVVFVTWDDFGGFYDHVASAPN